MNTLKKFRNYDRSFLLILFLVGLLATFSYGVYFDQNTEQAILFSNMKEYLLQLGAGDSQLVQVGFLGAPQLRTGDDALVVNLLLSGNRLGLLVEHHAGLIRQRHAGLACTAGHGQLRFQMSGGVVLRQGRADAQICQMGLRPEVQCHAAVNAGEAPEVLILQPGAGAALEHPQHQAVLAHADMTGQVEGVGGHGVLRVADLMAVEAHQHRKIGCLEDIAYNNGWISREQVESAIAIYKNNQYGRYLKDVLDGKFIDVTQ